MDEGGGGQRVDNFLTGQLKGVPKSHIYRILRSGEVRVNSGRVAASHKLALGDRVRIPPIRVAEREAGDAPAPALELPVLFEDDHILGVLLARGVAAGVPAPLLASAYTHLEVYQNRLAAGT